MLSSSNIGSKKIISKDVFDSGQDLFTTQKKRVLEFAKEKQIPSKFVIPLFKSKIRNPSASEISEDFITLEEYLSEKLESNKSILNIVEQTHDLFPNISEKEILFVGRADKRKGLNYLVASWSMISNQIND